MILERIRGSFFVETKVTGANAKPLMFSASSFHAYNLCQAKA